MELEDSFLSNEMFWATAATVSLLHVSVLGDPSSLFVPPRAQLAVFIRAWLLLRDLPDLLGDNRVLRLNRQQNLKTAGGQALPCRLQRHLRLHPSNHLRLPLPAEYPRNLLRTEREVIQANEYGDDRSDHCLRHNLLHLWSDGVSDVLPPT